MYKFSSIFNLEYAVSYIGYNSEISGRDDIYINT